MKPQNKPLHIICENKDDIADIVLMSGDPLRAKAIAEYYLDDYKLVNTLRNMFVYTGTYKGRKITVMGHGMGIGSIGIYTFELFYYFNVKKIIRIGTCGTGIVPLGLNELVLADADYSESTFRVQFCNNDNHFIRPSSYLNDVIIDQSKKLGININIGNVLTTDVFTPYSDLDSIYKRLPEYVKPMAEEMETFGLFSTAEYFKRDAACLLTIVDSKFSDKIVSPDDRQKSLNKMVILGLESLINS